MKESSKQFKALSSMDDSISLSSFDILFGEALHDRVFSGASLLVANPAEILFLKTWGITQEGGETVGRQTRFDLASLTKPLITTALSIWAVSRKKFSLEDQISRFFPAALVPNTKKAITIRHLLSHSSGLVPYKPYFKELISIPEKERADTLLLWMLQTPLVSPPGKSCHYSDLGFLLLGRILEVACEGPLDQLAEDVLLKPLRIDSLSYCRLEVHSDPTIPSKRIINDSFQYAATESCPWRKRLLVGEVHDENAYSVGGVAGHSGLFGTAEAVFLLISFLWKVYKGFAGDSGWSPDVVETFWTRQNLVSQSTWALGFDTPSRAHSSAGSYFSSKSLGHLGFTGTSIWLDLVQEVLVILLTNRVYPTRENDRIKLFRPMIHDMVMEAVHHSLFTAHS